MQRVFVRAFYFSLQSEEGGNMWFKNLRADIRAAKENDPAARNSFEIWLTYSGVHALSWHRLNDNVFSLLNENFGETEN